jgi:hypothetical protein
LNGKLLGDGRKPRREVFYVELETCEVPFDAGKIETFFSGLVLLEMKDVAIMPVDEVGDGRIQTFAIRAPQQEDSAVLQVEPPCCRSFSCNDAR